MATLESARPETSEVPDALAPPPGNPRFPLVDGLRGIAALSVVAFHADQFARAGNTIPGRVIGHLDMGVTVFFLITGFLLYRPFFAASVGVGPHISTPLFLWRRALRIVPAYWLALIVLLPIITLGKPFGAPNFLFLQIYRGATARSGIAPAWSVCVEVSFYVMLPFFAAALSRRWAHLPIDARRNRELGLLAALGIASLGGFEAVRATGVNATFQDILPGSFTLFALGMGLAVISVSAGRWTGKVVTFARRRPGRCWLLALALVCASLPMHINPDPGVVGHLRQGIIALLILMPVVFSEGAGLPSRILGNRPVAWLGLISYGIYLYHFPLMRHWIPTFTIGSKTENLLALGGFGIAASITCGAISYYALERHVLKLKRVSPLPLGARILARTRRALKGVGG
jgi:peptidoglycan/LPS O-acetylase OafA/YrhL